MNETIVAGLISGLVTLLVCIINNASIRKKADIKQDETITIIRLQLENLTKKVEEHNHIVARTYELEKNTALLNEQVKVANHRIEDLERANK